MTLAELNARVAGYNARQEVYWQRHAQLTAYILTALCGKRIRPETLLPEVFPARELVTAEERAQELEEIRREVGLE